MSSGARQRPSASRPSTCSLGLSTFVAATCQANEYGANFPQTHQFASAAGLVAGTACTESERPSADPHGDWAAPTRTVAERVFGRKFVEPSVAAPLAQRLEARTQLVPARAASPVTDKSAAAFQLDWPSRDTVVVKTTLLAVPQGVRVSGAVIRTRKVGAPARLRMRAQAPCT